MKLVWKILLELVVLMFLFAWYPDAARSIGDQLGMSRQFFAVTYIFVFVPAVLMSVWALLKWRSRSRPRE